MREREKAEGESSEMHKRPYVERPTMRERENAGGQSTKQSDA